MGLGKERVGTDKRGGVSMKSVIIISLICSGVTAVIVTKILATHYFKIVDGYVNDMVNMTKEFVTSIRCKHE